MSTTQLIIDDSQLAPMMVSTVLKNAHPDWMIIEAIEAARGDEALLSLPHRHSETSSIAAQMCLNDNWTRSIK